MFKNEIDINQAVVDRFVTFIKKGRLAHAYLFVGPADIGKTETALSVAKLVNCKTNTEGNQGIFCDRCPYCQKINSGNHPDVHVIETDYGETIKIDQVRELFNQIKLKSFDTGKKVFIIRNIENLTIEAGNALLKTLEEPTDNSLLLLTTTVPEKNLETVKSRCHVIHFYPASKSNLAARLTKHYDEDRLRTHFLAYFADGCFGKARRLKGNGIIERKNEIIDHFILSDKSEPFLKKILADKSETKELLDILLSWVRDAMLVKSGVNEIRLIHLDRVKELKSFQSQYSFAGLKDLNNEIVKTCKMLADNLNVKLPLFIIKEKLWAK